MSLKMLQLTTSWLIATNFASELNSDIYLSISATSSHEWITETVQNNFRLTCVESRISMEKDEIGD